MKIVSTKTSDGIIFHGLLSEPEKSKKKIIIHIHGMAGSMMLNSYYTAMHNSYPAEGYAFLAGEHRGTGTITQFESEDGVAIIGNAFEKFEDCVKDIQAWIGFAEQKGYEEIWLQSHSLGPSKVAYYMHTNKPDNIAGLIFISPSEMIGLVHDPEGVKDHNIMLLEAEKLVKEGNGKQLLSHKLWGSNLLSAETYLNLFSDDANTAIFNFWKDDQWDVVNNISVPVLAITGTKDDGIAPVIDPHKAMQKLKSELENSPRVKTLVYKNAEHSFDGFEKNIVEDVIKFVRS